MIPHGQIQTKTVKKLIIKDEWYDSANGYGNTLIFTDGSKGELYGCQDKECTIKEGDTITFKTAPNKFPDKPYVVIVSSINSSSAEAEIFSSQDDNNKTETETENHTSLVKDFTLKNYPAGNYYSHRIIFENGMKGELSRCSEKKPSWLKKGASLTFSLRHGKKADMPFIVLPDTTTNESTTSSSKFRKNDNNEPPQKSFKVWGSRLDDNPIFWLMRQKCISMTTCLDRANELVIGGVIDNDKRYEQALQDFNFIIKYAEMNDAGELELKDEFKKCNVPSKGKANSKGKEKEKNPELFDSKK